MNELGSPAAPGNGHIARLIQHLRNSPVKRMQFTFDGEREVCCPKYILTDDRDLIVKLLEAQAHQSPAEGGLNQTSGEEA